MTSTRLPAFDIHDLITRKAIDIHFQPIVSVRRQVVVGVEALSRGVNGTGELIPPMALFAAAEARGLALDLDRVCRSAAVEHFARLLPTNPELILFMYVHTASVETDTEGADSIVGLARSRQIDPRNLAIEILESEWEDTDRLRRAVERFHDSGFLVVLDDVGAGYSNLDRITYVRPDILKADRSLVQNLHGDYYKQEVLKAIVHLSERIGGWTVTEGVETLEDAVVILDLGGDMLQGYYFARPRKFEQASDLRASLPRVQDTANSFRSYTLDKYKSAQSLREQRLATVRAIVEQCAQGDIDSFDRTLQGAIQQFPSIESASVLDDAGMQITETIHNLPDVLKQKTIIFRMPARGTDHSLKEYFYVLMATQAPSFETDPYVPLPIGDLCITLSTRFEDAQGLQRVLCLHMNVDRG